LEPIPVVASLRFETRTADDRLCTAALTRQLKYDLRALQAAYFEGYGGDGGIVSTNFGWYGFGELECQDRVNLSNERISTALEQLDNACETDDDCVNVNIDTEAAVASVDAGVCTAYTEAGCPPPVALPCIPGVPHCLDGVCQ
jgi:hypothetical protein